MKAPTLGLLVAMVAFGGTSIYLWQQLREERALAAQAEAANRELNARIAALEQARTRFAERRFANNGDFVAASPSDAHPAADAPDAKATDKPERATWNMRRMEPSPAMQKMMFADMRANNRRLMPDIGDKLGLSKDKAGQLIDLLTQQQMEGFGRMRDFSDQADAQRYFEEKKTRDAQAISDLIGSDKAMQLEDYEASMPARHDFDQLARQLEGGDTPLTAEQGNKLRDIYVTERARVPMPEYTEGMDNTEYANAMNAWQTDYNQRVADQASSILSTQQLGTYNEIQQVQKEMRDQYAAAAANMPPGSRPPNMRRGGMMWGPPGTVTMGRATVNVPVAPPPPRKQ